MITVRKIISLELQSETKKIKYIPSNILYNVIHMEYPISSDHNSISFDASLRYNISFDGILPSQLNKTYYRIHLEYHM